MSARCGRIVARILIPFSRGCRAKRNGYPGDPFAAPPAHRPPAPTGVPRSEFSSNFSPTILSVNGPVVTLPVQEESSLSRRRRVMRAESKRFRRGKSYDTASLNPWNAFLRNFRVISRLTVFGVDDAAYPARSEPSHGERRQCLPARTKWLFAKL